MLLSGNTVPLPVSSDVMHAFTQAVVTNDDEHGDGFQLTFTLSKGLLDFGLVSDGTFDPFTRVTIAAVLGVVPEVLVDGWVTHHELTPGDRPGTSTLTVTGRDMGAKLDLEEKNEAFDNQPDFVIVNRLLLPMARYGVVPQVTPTTDVPISVSRTPWQNETDLQFLKRTARRNGFVTYFEPVTLGVSRAYWGPELRGGLPQPALTTNMGPSDTVKRIGFSYDSLAPEAPSGEFVDPIFGLSLPIPSLPSLRVPPLALSSAPAYRRTRLRDTANRSATQAALTELAAQTNAPDAITGTGELDTIRYGNILRARRLVGVRGVGRTYDGMYYVKRVQHRITVGSYTQSFSLSREGTGALLPVVVA
ncbi:MAG: hypothetical protein JWM87_245 [Candidatus Eremiobacteraeota bacterium]|nr:hypothetical protein [Candidatus Eremiobacteraeota bacterium]